MLSPIFYINNGLTCFDTSAPFSVSCKSENSDTKECGFFATSSCLIGTKNTFFLSSKMLMFCKLADKASFEHNAITVGLSERKWAFVAIVTDVSVIPLAIFASVFPVQGATIKASK